MAAKVPAVITLVIILINMLRSQRRRSFAAVLYEGVDMFEEEKAVVKRWVGLLTGNKDEVWDGFDQVLDPKMTWTVPGKTCVSGTHHGLDAINNDFFGKCWTTGDGRGGGVQGLDEEYGLKLEVQNLVALEDGRVLVTCTSDARGRNGVPYNNGYCWIITVRDGKIVELHEWCDTMMFETAMFDKKLVPAESLAESPRGSQSGE